MVSYKHTFHGRLTDVVKSRTYQCTLVDRLNPRRLLLLAALTFSAHLAIVKLIFFEQASEDEA